MSKAKQKAERGTMKKVLEYLRPYWGLVALSILLSAVTVALTLYVPILVGRAIGKHKLIPEVSPKKTVEGAVGGVVFAALGYALYGWIVLRFFPADARMTLSGGKVSLPVMALAGAVVAVISQIGDLAMSVIKRRYGVKDYGRIFPGHGGVLDRFDSVLLTAPVLMILSQIPAVSAYLV